MRAWTIPVIGATCLVSIVACQVGPVGSPCGRAQYASAHAVLPDTGINAKTFVDIGFVQHDPDLSGELSELSIEHVVPVQLHAANEPDPEPDPRVRLLTLGGRVLIDTLGTRSQPGFADRRTWLVFHWIRNAGERTALFEAFRDSALVLELWAPNATQPGTRVRPQIGQVGVTPPATCL